MSILDDIERTGTDMSSVFSTEDMPVVFSPRKYNRCMILYSGKSGTSVTSEFKTSLERLYTLLDAVSTDFQIGLCTEDEMMTSHCFRKYPEHTKRLQLQNWTHMKPFGEMIVILFNIDKDFSINCAIRIICNLYAVLHKFIVWDKKYITCLMYSQDEDHPDFYRLCCDDSMLLIKSYEIITGTYKEAEIFKELMIEDIGGAMTGDFGSCTLPKTCNDIYKRYRQLNEMHKNKVN